jgi:acyl-CoA reductase-like NAD-dependent aldehyde dehydrogenase
VKYVRTELFIDGRWRPSSTAEMITVVSPATEMAVGQVPNTTTADVDTAVDSARRALRAASWSTLEPAKRAGALRRFADALERRAGKTAAIVTDENGMPASIALPAEGRGPAAVLRYYADLAEMTPPEALRVSPAGRRTIVRREPVGVVAAVIPWNFPQSLTMFKLAPALAAGCTVVVKPAPETAVDAFQLADAAVEAGLPPGVLNIISGGADIGAYLVGHPAVDRVALPDRQRRAESSARPVAAYFAQ